MSRPAPLAVTLVQPLSGGRPSWEPDTLREHLEVAGPDVRLMPAGGVVSGQDADVVHCFGVDSARGIDDPVVVRPMLVNAVLRGRRDGRNRTPPRSSRPPRASSCAARASRSRCTGSASRGTSPGSFRSASASRHTRAWGTWLTAPSGSGRSPRSPVLLTVAGTSSRPCFGSTSSNWSSSSDPSDGPAASPRRVAGLRAMVRDAEMAESCVFVAPSSDGERAWWLRSAHVVLAVPHGQGGVELAAQAMACGTPVVATPDDALVDVVVHGVTGFMVGIGEPLAIARALHAVLRTSSRWSPSGSRRPIARAAASPGLAWRTSSSASTAGRRRRRAAIRDQPVTEVQDSGDGAETEPVVIDPLLAADAHVM